MIVTVAFFTSISAVYFSGSPGNVIEETIAQFTVQPLGVVFTDASPMYHALHVLGDTFNGSTLRGMSVTEAVTPYHQLIQSVIILFLYFQSGIQ